ncbi:MAG: hypothetical protein M0P47_07790 [Bacteroidales bacterium]|nr:hypothetical protein [Bacteroidales bacterium]
MKKKTNIIIGIVLVLAIVIIAISFMFPTVFKGITSGTIGKADKYHKIQMTEKDVMLRSELLTDTSQLRNMIQGLIYFSLFTQDFSNKIDSCINAFQDQGLYNQAGGGAKVSILQDYSDFIKNNNKTLRTTISMLTGFYLKDESDQSLDVEKNLRDFSVYVNNLNEKDSIFNLALRSMDGFILTNKALKAKKTELANLKSIRDQLLVKGIQLAGMLQNKTLCSQLLSYALSSQQELNAVVLGKQALNSVASQQNIQNVASLLNSVQIKAVEFGSSQQLGKIIQAQQMGHVVAANRDLGSSSVGNVLVYDKPTLQFIYGSQKDLQRVFSASEVNSFLNNADNLGRLQGVAYSSSQGLNLYQSQIDLKSGYSSQMKDLGMTISNAQLNQIFNSHQDLGVIIYSQQFIGMTQELRSMGLGMGAER